MNIKTVAAIFAGSVAVHAVVIACTSSSTGTSGERNASADSPPAAAEVSPETCSQTYDAPILPRPGSDAGTETIHYAEHAYPGKSKEEIAAHVTHWTPIDDPGVAGRPPAYQGGLNLQSAVYTRDGFAGAGCGPGQTTYFIWKP